MQILHKNIIEEQVYLQEISNILDIHDINLVYTKLTNFKSLVENDTIMIDVKLDKEDKIKELVKAGMILKIQRNGMNNFEYIQNILSMEEDILKLLKDSVRIRLTLENVDKEFGTNPNPNYAK